MLLNFCGGRHTCFAFELMAKQKVCNRKMKLTTYQHPFLSRGTGNSESCLRAYFQIALVGTTPLSKSNYVQVICPENIMQKSL